MNRVKTEKKPQYQGHRARVKEKFLKNYGRDFHEYELLEILLFASNLRQDTKPLAKKLLGKFGDLDNIINADSEALRSVNGISDSAIVFIKVVKEIINRSLREKISQKPLISGWEDLLNYCRIKVARLKQERLEVIFLDKKHHIIAEEISVQGSIENIVIDFREIVKKALIFSASSIILIHNHPSGDSSPSKADIENTAKITKALKAVNIMVYDHLIIGGKNYYSFRNSGLL